MRAQRAVGAALIVLAAMLAGCSQSHTYRYRLTLIVRADGKDYTGSSVVEVEEHRTYNGGLGKAELCGDATLVDLGQGRVLVALTAGPNGNVSGRDFLSQRWRQTPTYILLEHLGYDTQWSWRNPAGINALANESRQVLLSPTELPDLVTFANLRDPQSIRQVDPGDIAATMGAGVSLVGATVKPTHDEVTVGSIRNYLPWFDESEEFIDGSKTGNLVLQYQTYKFQRCRRVLGLFNIPVLQG
jgi:hypothetical protein